MNITPDSFAPYGDFKEYVDANTIMACTVDGVEWFTDRRLLIRADLVEPRPSKDHMWDMRPADTEAVEKFVRSLLDDPKPSLTLGGLAAIYVADAEDAGLQLRRGLKFWTLGKGGEIVGCVAPITDAEGMLPGGITPTHRAVYGVLEPLIYNRWQAWETAVKCADIASKAAK